jgi:murein DD-endopeptidase MepM/ murein hydrolase activator NlpD
VRSRRLPLSLLAAVLLLPLLAPAVRAPAQEAPDPNSRAALLEAIEGASAEEVLAVQQLLDARAKRTELDGKVAALDAELKTAAAKLREVEAEVARVQEKVDAVQRDVDRIEGEIRKSKDIVEESAVSIYKAAAGGNQFPLLSTDGSSHALIAGNKYVGDRSKRQQRELLAQGALRDELGDARDDLQKEVDRARVAERAAQQERDRVGGLRAEAEAQRADAAAAESQEQELLDSIRARKAEFQQQYDALQARINATLSRGSGAPANLSTGGGGSGQLAWPVSGPVSSGFGNRQDPFGNGTRMHTGIDIVASSGTPITAAADGTVNSAGWNGGYGNAVVVDHGDGLATLYGHMSRIGSSGGQSVSRGEVIGYVGSTGNSTGPHLHFEVRVNGSPQNPMNYL